MLVISRRPGQSILIGDDIEVEVIETSPGKVKLGISAPWEVRVLRNEILLTSRENLIAARTVSQEAVRGLVDRIRPQPDIKQPSGKLLPDTSS